MTDRVHMLIAADEEDAKNYVSDPYYTHINYVGDAIAGMPMHEVSFTPRATNMPDWVGTLKICHTNIVQTVGSWRGRVHYITLFEEP